MAKEIPYELLRTCEHALKALLDFTKSAAIHHPKTDPFGKELLMALIEKREKDVAALKQFQIDLCNGEFDSVNPTDKGEDETQRQTGG